jgi:hypothetical protein
MSWPVGKCPNMKRSYLFSLIGKQKKIAPLIAGHPVVLGFYYFHKLMQSLLSFKICRGQDLPNFGEQILIKDIQSADPI